MKRYDDIRGRLIRSVRQKGIRETLLKLRIIVTDVLFDLRYGIDTCSWSQLDELTIDSDNKSNGHRYEPTRVLPLRKLFGEFRAIMPEDSVLVDFGCGKGRVLFVASEFGFQEVRGVEFARELCEVARKNSLAHRIKSGTGTEYRIIEGDAAAYPISKEENVFFLFNPFDGTILRRVLGNIVRSVKEHPRKVLIIYHNPQFDHLVGSGRNFKKISQYSFCGWHFSLFSNMAQSSV